MTYENNALVDDTPFDVIKYLQNSSVDYTTQPPVAPLQSTTILSSQNPVYPHHPIQGATTELAPVPHQVPAALGRPHDPPVPSYYNTFQATQNIPAPMPAIHQETSGLDFQLPAMDPILGMPGMPHYAATCPTAYAPLPNPALLSNPVFDPEHAFEADLTSNPWAYSESFESSVDSAHIPAAELFPTVPSAQSQSFVSEFQGFTTVNDTTNLYVPDITNWVTSDTATALQQVPPQNVPAATARRTAPAPRPSEVARASRSQNAPKPYDREGVNPRPRNQRSSNTPVSSESVVPLPLNTNTCTRFFIQPPSLPHLDQAARPGQVPKRVRDHICPYICPRTGTACWTTKSNQPVKWLKQAGNRKSKGFFTRHQAETLRHMARHRLQERRVPHGKNLLDYYNIPEEAYTLWDHESIDWQLIQDAFELDNQSWSEGEVPPSMSESIELMSVSPYFSFFVLLFGFDAV